MPRAWSGSRPVDAGADYSRRMKTALITGASRDVAKALSVAKKGGAFLLCSSVVVGSGAGRHAAISAAKGTTEIFSRSLTMDFSFLGLRGNDIAPRLLRTPISECGVAHEAAARPIAPNRGFAAVRPAARAG